MRTYSTLTYAVENKILTLTLNRPEHLNAFTVEMSHELIEAFQTASQEDDVGVIVVTGAGKAFCAGMDLGVGGNVFGLNTQMHPTLEDMQDKLDDADMANGVRDSGGKVVLAMARWPLGPRSTEAG